MLVALCEVAASLSRSLSRKPFTAVQPPAATPRMKQALRAVHVNKEVDVVVCSKHILQLQNPVSCKEYGQACADGKHNRGLER